MRRRLPAGAARPHAGDWCHRATGGIRRDRAFPGWCAAGADHGAIAGRPCMRWTRGRAARVVRTGTFCNGRGRTMSDGAAIRVRVNGAERLVPARTAVAALVDGPEAAAAAIARNREVVPRAQWDA